MGEFIAFLSFLGTNIQALSFLVVVVGGVFAWVKFREYVKDKRFTTYHNLIDQLVDDKSHPSGKLMLDRQIAIVFELRSFPKYYKVTQRILEGLKNEETWKTGNPRLVEEVDLTLEYINSNIFCRLFKR
ncbi:MAG: hypothetical protein Q7S04_03020 [Candidatus Moranbacteria bacterium]|nr:hypothetical protein [Candidatus Moranbacteria bacterium]